ncbi:glycosyltransferase family 2 protein [Photobacterium leiognathi]|uniref:glycosyltransferase family 2 protein n=1 Tax=Photobacterium leiognathi TaxID=553611 RepID=UPI0029810183|nr:glycosyltransferase family 2 protein [Photobacterium leiognathi]
MSCLIIIPCLNEADHIGDLLTHFSPSLTGNSKLVVVDGGSHDGTQEIVERWSEKDDHIVLLHNPDKIQSAAMNLAVEQFGDDYEYFIRIDAHGQYPEDFITTLLAEAEKHQADSVVVSMYTEGHTPFQVSAAIAQNSKLGNGGSPHRNAQNDGKWVEHGHHALMKVSAYRAVGGYDETFVANEDAELDKRLTDAGYKIWLTGQTDMTYFPRKTPESLFKQYYNYGKGRAANCIKHNTIPKLRQLIPLSVVPVLLMALLLGEWHFIFALPALLWVAACVLVGATGKSDQFPLSAKLSGIPAMIMHFGWSLGFCAALIFPALRRKPVHD